MKDVTGLGGLQFTDSTFIYVHTHIGILYTGDGGWSTKSRLWHSLYVGNNAIKSVIVVTGCTEKLQVSSDHSPLFTIGRLIR